MRELRTNAEWLSGLTTLNDRNQRRGLSLASNCWAEQIKTKQSQKPAKKTKIESKYYYEVRMYFILIWRRYENFSSGRWSKSLHYMNFPINNRGYIFGKISSWFFKKIKTKKLGQKSNGVVKSYTTSCGIITRSRIKTKYKVIVCDTDNVKDYFSSFNIENCNRIYHHRDVLSR